MSNNLAPNSVLSPDECDQAFAAVRSCRTVEQASQAFIPLLCAYIPTAYELHSGIPLWRARQYDEGEQRWNNVADIGPPPANRAKTGRLNSAGRPGFYGATNPSTALIEIGTRENKLVQLGSFRLKPDHTIQVAVLGDLHHAERTHTTRLGGPEQAKLLRERLQRLGMKRGESMQYIDAFFAGILADPMAGTTEYVLSRGFARALHSIFAVDGIVYPSVQYDAGLNIAVSADVFKAHFEPRSCTYLAIDRIREFGFISFKQIDCATSVDDTGEFSWMPARSDYEFVELNLSNEEREGASEWDKLRGAGFQDD